MAIHVVSISNRACHTYVNKCLSEIIKNENQVKQIINYIKQKREIKVIEDIKRIYNK